MRLSIVIPAYNEESRLPLTLERVRAALGASDREIIVVDDGSRDGTAEEAARAGASVVRLARNGGRGAAVRAGIEAARGGLVLEMDADGSVDAEAITRFADHFDRHPGVDVLIGSRNALGSVVVVPQPFLRVFLGGCFLFAAKAFFGWDISDYTLGFKMFRREAAADIMRHQHDAGYLAEAEIVVAARGRGWRLQELPVRWAEYGASKVRPWREAWRSLRGLAVIVARFLRGGYAPAPGRLSFSAAKRRTTGLYDGLGWPSLFARIRFFTAPYAGLEPHVPREGLIVDLGCGYGTFSNLLGLMAPGRRVVGLDYDTVKLRHAPRGLGNVTFRDGDVRTAVTEPADAILLIHVLHHLGSYEEQEPLLASCREKLKPDGRLVVCEVDRRPYWKYLLGWLADRLLYPGDDIFYRFPEDLAPILERCGFRVDTIRSDAATPFAHVTYVGIKR
ncbi:MAG: glycosyltransferase [Elusimicrobia bacterium]|nr:glycosyltransferase [Elusimicrobiota bacterium]